MHKMNTSLSPAEKRKYENEFSEFLLKRIANAGGSLQLQHLTGHLSQLKSAIRNAFGTSTIDLIHFIKEHDNLFFIEKNVVSLVHSSFRQSDYESDSSSIKSYLVLPSRIENGKGVVVKLFREYGFIKSKEPIKTEVYFKASCYGSKDIDLTKSLYIGAVVFFHAAKESSTDLRSKYKATKVWKPDDSGFENNPVPKSRKNRETGLYDPLTCESDGVIQRVFPNLGFIAVKGDDRNTVFFHKNRVVGYDNVVDLTKILEKGDRVEFLAHRSTKPDSKARWEATKVWKIGTKAKQSPFVSYQSNIDFPSVVVKTETKEMIKDKTGKICLRSPGAVIKFGHDQLADGDSALYYVSGAQVTDIGWVFSEGEEVKFDAVKIKSAPGWKAVLVWVGDKPDIVLPTCIGDFSEFTDEEETEISSPVYTSKSSSYVSLCSLSSKSTSVKSDSNSSKKNNIKEKISRSRDSLNDEVTDYFSIRSLSSKPTSVKSDSNSSKKNNIEKQNLSKSRDSINDEVTDYKETKSKSYNFHEDTSSSCATSKNSQKLKKYYKNNSKQSNLNSNKISNWGDSPYPGEENFENKLYSKISKSERVDKLVVDNNVKKIADDSESLSDHEAEDGISNSEESNNNNNLTESNLKVKASINKFYDIEGIVCKVYSKYAEVKSCNLENTVSFFWNDFYSNGISVEELELDDLKQALKVGDSVKFNCFVIIDNKGQSWQRVPLAWVGSKPKYCVEISPQDFIKQHNLDVTISNEVDCDEIFESKANCQKFLSSFEDVVPDNHSDKLSNTESSYEGESQSCKQSLKEPFKMPHSLDFKNASSTVRQMLKKIFFPDSEIDLKVVSEEIVHIISDTYNEKKSHVICSACERKTNPLNRDVNKKDSEVQTLITGNIIAQNIFPEC